MYYKGANILHTLRQLVEDDEKWRQMLRGMNEEFYHSTVSSKQVEDYLSAQKGADLSSFFDQYLRTTMIPMLKYKVDGNKISFSYDRVVEGFDMPVIALINGEEEWIFPTSEWKSMELDAPVKSFAVKRDFYVESQAVDQ